jgi:hypothetical protein
MQNNLNTMFNTFFAIQKVQDSQRYAGIYTRTQKRVHNAKVKRITPHYVVIEDRNDGSEYKYRQTSLKEVNCG